MIALAAVLVFHVTNVSIYMAALYIAAPVLAAPVLMFRTLQSARKGSDFHSSERLVKYGQPIVASAFLYPLAYSLPQFLIMRSGAPGDVGVYGIALMFAALLQPLNDALRSYFIPKVAGFATRDDALRHMVSVLKKVPLVIFVLSLALLATNVAYHFLFEQKYPAAGGTIAALLSASVIAVVGGIASSVMHALGIPELDMKVNVVRVAVVALSAYLLIPHLGPLGGGLSTLLGIIVGEVFSLVIVLRRLSEWAPSP
jgi:O-antigen/teichoic acid export membrane protein